MAISRFVPTPANLRPPIGDALTTPAGMATPLLEQYLTNLNQVLQSIAGIRVVVTGDDSTSAIQSGINQAIAQGGGVVVLPAGRINTRSVFIPASAPPVTIIGQGSATVLVRSGELTPGQGLIDISAPFVTLSDFSIDGATTVPKGLQYGADFSTSMGANDPMAPSLTNNTSIWVHGNGNTSNYVFQRLLLTHAAGYSILLDALGGDISDVDILECWLMNNRPTLFGTMPGQLIYGSWNGGILSKGDGRTATGSQSGVVNNLLVGGCRFQRGCGNQVWSHNYGFQRFHSNFRYADNQFLDCGLDGILVDVVSGGIVSGNVMRRIGYVSMTDTDQAIPRWLPGVNATGIDSGVVKGVPYVGNSLTSVAGGFIDLDSHSMSSISSNLCRIPYVDEPEYITDQIAISGPGGGPNASYGLNLAVNYPFAEGGEYINIEGNTLLNLPSGAMRLYASRFCNVVGNIIQAPTDSTFAPIQLGPNGPNAYNRCYGNKISQNQIQYAPGSALPVVLEDNSLSGGNPMTAGEANTVCNNNPIQPAGSMAIEFQKAVGSGSTVYGTQIWF